MLSKVEELSDIGNSMSIGNLILGVNSVTVSCLIHYDSLLQNATEIYYRMRQLLQITMFLLQNATVITNCSSTMCNIANLFDTNIRKLDVKKTVFCPECLDSLNH